MTFDLIPATDVPARTPSTLEELLKGIGESWARADEGGEELITVLVWERTS